jgi:hypothetical protein
VLLKDHLFLSAGNKIFCLRLPSLDIIWQKKVDMATCFGIYLPLNYDFLISYGELSISRIDFSGKIRWQAAGKDIFTNGLTFSSDHIEILDFNHERYRISLPDGKISLQNYQ